MTWRVFVFQTQLARFMLHLFSLKHQYFLNDGLGLHRSQSSILASLPFVRSARIADHASVRHPVPKALS
jgi:hypothetical protein